MRAGPVLVLAFGFAAGFAACARTGPPPGGPMDTTAPSVVSVSPGSLAVGVPADAPITVEFSEKIDPKSMEMALWVTPGGAAKPSIDVSGETATVRISGGFPESTTVGVLLTTVIRDRKREGQQNPMTRPYRWHFSTGDSLWEGMLRGKVARVGGSATQGQLLVGLYPGDADTVPDPAETPPLAITQADTSGRFELAGLPADGRPRWLFALFDRDGNREIRGKGEFASAEPESVILTAGQPALDLAMRLVDPEAPGDLQGSLVRAEGDTMEVWLEIFEAGADSLARPARRARVEKQGAFSVGQVPPGTYRVIAFCDLNRNGEHDPEEDAVSLGEVTVSPGETRELGQWTGPRCIP